MKNSMTIQRTDQCNRNQVKVCPGAWSGGKIANGPVKRDRTEGRDRSKELAVEGLRMKRGGVEMPNLGVQDTPESRGQLGIK